MQIIKIVHDVSYVKRVLYSGLPPFEVLTTVSWIVCPVGAPVSHYCVPFPKIAKLQFGVSISASVFVHLLQFPTFAADTHFSRPSSLYSTVTDANSVVYMDSETARKHNWIELVAAPGNTRIRIVRSLSCMQVAALYLHVQLDYSRLYMLTYRPM